MLNPTRNTLPESVRGQSVEHLNRLLAAAIDLHAQLKQAHWNVRGPNFIAVHELFDKVSTKAEDISDMLAERVGALGGTAHGTVQISAGRSFLVPYPLGLADGEKHIFAVAGTLAAFGQDVQEGITKATKMADVTTADLLTEVSRTIDMQLWFVESHAAHK